MISRDLEPLMESYIKNRKRDLLYLRDYLFQRRYREAGDVIHGLKGVLGSYGIDQGFQLSQTIERYLHEREYESARRELKNLEEYIDELEIEYTDEEF